MATRYITFFAYAALAAVFLSAALFSTVSYAASSGTLEGAANFAGTCANVNDAVSDGDADADADCEDGETVIAQNFNTAGVPSDAVQIGFQVTVIAETDNTGGDDEFDLSISSDSVAALSVTSNENVTSTSDQSFTYPSGSNCSTFGHTWSVADLTGLKVTLTADPDAPGTEIEVDDIDVIVCYITITITEADFQGVENQFTATVAPNASIPTELDATIVDFAPWNASSANDWQSVSWQIGADPAVCDSGPNFTAPGAVVYGDDEAFNITAPATPGTYDVVFKTYGTNNCTGETASYTFQDAIIVQVPTGTLTLLKEVVNDNGGTAVDTDWTLSANGPTPISGSEGDASITSAVVDPGTYDLSESGPAGYSSSGVWQCVGGDQTDDATVEIEAGDDVTCTIENNDDAPALTLIKVVVNDNGGTATTTDWTLTATGPTSFSGAGPIVGNGPSFDAGTYDLSESGGNGEYADSDWVCVGGNQTDDATVEIALGESVTCTITNDDIAPVLQLEKTLIQDNGGTASEGDWVLSANGPTPFNGAGNAVSGSDFVAGTYDLSESGPSGYSASDWVCTGGNQIDEDTVEVGLAESVTCTIENDDIAPQLTVIKLVVNDNGGTATSSDFTMQVGGTNVQPFDTFPGSATGTTVTLDAGGYGVGEAAFNGYTRSFSGDCAPNGLGTIGVGEHHTCTVTNNDEQGFIVVSKVVINDHGGTATTTDFAFTLDGGGPIQFTDFQMIIPVDAGVHSIVEVLPAGYTVTYLDNDGNTNCDNLVVLNGQVQNIEDVATCQITNDDIAAPPPPPLSSPCSNLPLSIASIRIIVCNNGSISSNTSASSDTGGNTAGGSQGGSGGAGGSVSAGNGSENNGSASGGSGGSGGRGGRGGLINTGNAASTATTTNDTNRTDVRIVPR